MDLRSTPLAAVTSKSVNHIGAGERSLAPFSLRGGPASADPELLGHFGGVQTLGQQWFDFIAIEKRLVVELRHPGRFLFFSRTAPSTAIRFLDEYRLDQSSIDPPIEPVAKR